MSGLSDELKQEFYEELTKFSEDERKQGRLEGVTYATARVAVRLVLNGKLSREEICDVCGLSDSTLQRFIDKYLT